MVRYSYQERRCAMKRIWIGTGLLLALSLMVAACGSRITAEEIVAKMQETIENTQDAHAIVTVALDLQGEGVSATVELWERSPNKIRAEALEASEPELVGMLLVSDGERGWAYSPQNNEVTVGSLGDLELPLPQEMLIELQDALQAMLDASDIELVGEEKTADRQAYLLRMSPKEDSKEGFFPGDGKATLWVTKRAGSSSRPPMRGGPLVRGVWRFTISS
jgi:outer membrane lipoprotein-sorting protein